MLSDQDLARVLEAASKGCTEKCKGACLAGPCGPHCDYPYTDERATVCEPCKAQGEAKGQLRALAPALAQEVLDTRAALARIEKAAREAVESSDSEVIDELHEARKDVSKALNRWAELTETEVRDG